MDRSELYMLDTYKREELKKRLKPINDWTKVNQGQYLFHETDNNIFNVNQLLSVNLKENMVKYQDRNSNVYEMSLTGWYHYDEFVADEVGEYWTPKLYIVTPIDQSDEYELMVACNENHLYSCFLEKHKEIQKGELTLDEFNENYSFDLVKEVDEFSIKCV
jgi:hypothetical protein